ncbi:LemA family protein [Desulfovibrio sp. OttesenSCG-928-C06]|nr:LemA family protein [Desulfovibrio sp. OttesenSCG-928-C06]
MIPLIIIGVVVFILAAFLISLYNRLVALRARFRNAFSQIEVQLTRRYDLIPNLVETAKGYLKHESETLTKITEARSGAIQSLKEAAANPGAPESILNLNQAEKALNSSLHGLRIQIEAYPDLKASTNMIQLSEELASTENRIAFARQAYNDEATLYNIQRNSFPANMFAGMFGHGEDAALLAFENAEEIQKAPRVQF